MWNPFKKNISEPVLTLLKGMESAKLNRRREHLLEGEILVTYIDVVLPQGVCITILDKMASRAGLVSKKILYKIDDEYADYLTKDEKEAICKAVYKLWEKKEVGYKLAKRDKLKGKCGVLV